MLKTRFSSSGKGAPKMSTNSARWLLMIASRPLSSSLASSRRLVGSAPVGLADMSEAHRWSRIGFALPASPAAFVASAR